MTINPETLARPAPPKWLTETLNTIIGVLLRSPLHGLLSKQALLLSFKGRKSGKVYTFPIGYYHYEGDTLILIPLHRWWVNLQGNVPVTIWLKGRKYNARANATQGDDTTIAELQKLILESANLMRVYQIERDAQGQPDAQRLRLVASALSLVRIQIIPG